MKEKKRIIEAEGRLILLKWRATGGKVIMEYSNEYSCATHGDLPFFLADKMDGIPGVSATKVYNDGDGFFIIEFETNPDELEGSFLDCFIEAAEEAFDCNVSIRPSNYYE